jgi:hypothetical protein
MIKNDDNAREARVESKRQFQKERENGAKMHI